MKASVSPILDVLGAPGILYAIPVYQRRYAWTRDDCRILFEDIMAAGQTGRTHFLASILTAEPESAPAASLRRLEVIDGQQRLTTCSIIIAALLDRLNGMDSDRAADLLGCTPGCARRTYLYDDERRGDARWRIAPTDADRDAFHTMASGGTPPRGTTVGDNLAWFARRLAGLDDRELAVFIQGLRSLRVVTVAVDPDDDAQAVFESMNAKGEPLTTMDLVRNHLLMGLNPDGQEAAWPVWQSIETLFDPKGFDDFLYQWLVYRHSDPPTERDTYRLFRRLETGDGTLEALAEGARLYHRLFAPGAHDQIPATLRPLAMRMAGRDDAERSLALLDAYSLRRSLCGLPTASLGGPTRRALRMLDQTDDQTPERVAALLLGLSDTKARFPTDMELTRALTGDDLYRRPAACRRLLELLEDRAHPNEHVDGLTIEHILPRRPGGEWPADARRTVRTLGGTLGNLTLTGSNSMLSNRGFAYKRDLPGFGYAVSPLWLNRGLGALDAWDADAIRARGARLASVACAILPYPTAYADMVEAYRASTRDTAAPLPATLTDGPCAARFAGLSRLVARLHPDWERRPRRDYVGWYAPRLRVTVQGRANGRMYLSVHRTGLDDPKRLLSTVGCCAGLPLAMPVDDDLTGVEAVLRQLG